jgi:acyl-coenzyme A synthetase/AMP-(fatty) acid ligase
VANYVRDVLAAHPRDDRALVALTEEGRRTEWTFRALLDAAERFAGRLAALGIGRGSVVLTLVGNTIEYPLTMLACLHLGAVMLPCSEQLRAKDVRLRMDRARPALVICDRRNRAVLDEAAPECAVLTVPLDLDGLRDDVPGFADLGELDPAFVLFTSGTSGEPKLVTHGQRYLYGQHLQARHWMAARAGDLVWSTAAPGWSKSARNAFLAPWLCGAAALLQDRRFDAAERLATVRGEQVDVLCMAPTEFRLIAAHGPITGVPSLRRLITAGEALGIPALTAWREQTGLTIADGYGQTETGHVTGVGPDESAPPGSMGRPLPGIRTSVVDGELCLDPDTVPTFFLGYDGQPPPSGLWHTGDRVHTDSDGWLFFESRADDVIVSAGYRIGPAEVESTLLSHAAVRECAVIGEPDEARGQIVVAVVVPRDGVQPSDDLARELQEHVKAETAPYKYPRRVRFVAELPKTTSGKLHRAALRLR